MSQQLKGLSIAILVTDGFEEVEMTKPREALDQAGAKTVLVSPMPEKVTSWHMKNWSKEYTVDLPLDKAQANDFDALLLPGGVINPDRLRLIPEAIEFIKKFVAADKPIAAICHGPWTLINAHGVKGKTLTSWPSLQVDLVNAGANWVDKEVVRDGNLITSRKPEDISAFNCEIIALLAEKACT